jgi:hypothetical protein
METFILLSILGLFIAIPTLLLIGPWTALAALVVPFCAYWVGQMVGR